MGKWDIYLKAMTDGASESDNNKLISTKSPLKINIVILFQEHLSLTTAGNIPFTHFEAIFDEKSLTPV